MDTFASSCYSVILGDSGTVKIVQPKKALQPSWHNVQARMLHRAFIAANDNPCFLLKYKRFFLPYKRKHSALWETLNKISKTINWTYAEWAGMIQGFQIYFTWNPRLKGVEGPCWVAQPIQPYSGQSRLKWLCFLAQPFYAFQSKISCKTYLESLNHTRSPCLGPNNGLWYFI